METRKKLLWAAGEIISAGWTAFSLFQNFVEPSNFDWRVSALIGFVLFVFIVFVHLVSLNGKLDSRQPNIRLSGDEIEHILVGMRPARKEERAAQFVRAVFANNPKNPTDQNWGRNVRAVIRIRNTEDVVGLLPTIDPRDIEGRWSQSAQPPTVNDGEQVELENMDFPSNGSVRYLDLLMKYREDNYAFAYNNSSYIFGENYFRRPDYELRATRIEIEVELRGDWLRSRKFYFDVVVERNGDIKQTKRRPTRWEKVKHLIGERLEKAGQKIRKIATRIKPSRGRDF